MKRVALGFAIFLVLSASPNAQTAAPAYDPSLQNSAAPSGQMSEGERRFRMMLLQRSMGFGGIFGPMIAPLNKPGAPKKSCGAYSDPAACAAHRNGDGWAADRLQQKRSNPSERAWYGG